jgi:hypothetical protein
MAQSLLHLEWVVQTLSKSDVTGLFNLMKAVLVTPDKFTQLPRAQQGVTFDKLKDLANSDDKGVVYRPIYPLPGSWEMYQESITKAFPKGETWTVKDLAMGIELYRQLYWWMTGACKNCGSCELIWCEGDKHVEYWCPSCHDETPFVKGAWAYY